MFELMFSRQTSRALGLNYTDSSVRHCSPKRCAFVGCATVCHPLSYSRSHCESLHPAPAPHPTPPPHQSDHTQLSPLAGVHITSPDLLPVLAAGQLGRLKPLLHCHEPLLNAAAAQLCAVRPTRPRSHFTPCGGIKSEEILDRQKTFFGLAG